MGTKTSGHCILVSKRRTLWLFIFSWLHETKSWCALLFNHHIDILITYIVFWYRSVFLKNRFLICSRFSRTPNTTRSPSTMTSRWSSWPRPLRWHHTCRLYAWLKPLTTSLAAWNVLPPAGAWPATTVGAAHWHRGSSLGAIAQPGPLGEFHTWIQWL